MLKTLEEPPDHSLFLVVSSRPYALPATIRSRCQALRLTAPAQTQVEAAVILKRELPPADAHFLAVLSDGQLGRALECDLEQSAEQPEGIRRIFSVQRPRNRIATVLAAAEALCESRARHRTAFDWLLRWMRDVAPGSPSAPAPIMCSTWINEAGMQALAGRIDIDELLDLIHDLEKLERAGAIGT